MTREEAIKAAYDDAYAVVYAAFDAAYDDAYAAVYAAALDAALAAYDAEMARINKEYPR